MRLPTRTQRRTDGGTPYHHGALREALLKAAEHILERDGIQGLTLRAAAREAGVSHAAPKNHFDDLQGLLSELAALGFERFRAALLAEVVASDPPVLRRAAIGRGYVGFARAHPGLFLLMFRSERLDPARPALRQAMQGAFAVLSGMVAERIGAQPATADPSLAQLAGMAGAWSLVHGFAMLLLDGRLAPLLARLPEGADEAALLAAVLTADRFARD